jgi:hypothetical protein
VDGQAIDSANDPQTNPVPPDVSLSDIFLTDEEKKEALSRALWAKRAKISQERTRTIEKLKALEKDILGPQTPKDLWYEVQLRGRQKAHTDKWENEFRIPEFSREIYQALCYYFTGDLAMQDYGLSPRKGLMLYGNVGCGKTILMELLARNPVQSYKVISCEELEIAYKKKDAAELVLDKYSNMLPNEYKSAYYNQDLLGVCFDDFGSEKMGNHFGDTREIMYNILSGRYRNQTCKGPKTHLTSNLTLDVIQERYGERLMSRMNEMFNLIDFPADAPDLRKQTN